MAYRAFTDDFGEPDFVNKIGAEFRAEISLTKYARDKLGYEYVVWRVSGTFNPTYLLAFGQIEVHEDTSYDGIACHIDCMEFCKRDY